MEIFDLILSAPIQLGFDIATSLTIIGSLAYFVISMRKKTKEERIQRFDKQVRSVAAEQLRVSLEKLSLLFIGDLIKSSEDFKVAFGLSQDKGLERETKRLKREGQTEKAIECLESANNAVGEFYEELHKEKYNIIPVIDSIEDDAELVRKFNEQLSKISSAFNSQNNSVRGLIHELKGLSSEIQNANADYKCSNFEDFHKTSEENGGFNDLMKKSASIFYDEDYLYWTTSFVPDGKEESFSDAVKSTSSLSEMDEDMSSVFISCCASLISQLLDNPERLYAQVFFEASRKQTQSNVACKDVLINLSAILKYLLKADSDETSLSDIVKNYEGEEYFNLKVAIR